MSTNTSVKHAVVSRRHRKGTNFILQLLFKSGCMKSKSATTVKLKENVSLVKMVYLCFTLGFAFFSVAYRILHGCRDTKFLFSVVKYFTSKPSKRVKYVSSQEEKFLICCKRHNLLCSCGNGDLFMCEDNLLFSHVKISCFCMKAHLVFHWCLYNKFLSLIAV